MSLERLGLLHLAFTSAMLGVISVVQLVVYPQYELVPQEVFADYVTNHGFLIGIALALFAPAEVLLALLLWRRSPSGQIKTVAFIAGLLLFGIWLTTALWFGVLHGRLISEPYNPDTIDLLANTNWARTVLWWARGGLAVWLVDRLIARKSNQLPGGGV